MKPKQALKDLWQKGWFESARTTKDIEKQLESDYGTSSENLTAVLNNCPEFLRKKGKAEWRQRLRYDAAVIDRFYVKKIDFFSMLDIHPTIQRVSKKLFQDGYYPEAIFAAFKAVNNSVKVKSAHYSLDGKKLMLEVFSRERPILALNDNNTIFEKDEQEGFMYLFAGAIQGIRNPKAHDEVVQRDQKVTLQYLAFASLLCRMVDKSKKVR